MGGASPASGHPPTITARALSADHNCTNATEVRYSWVGKVGKEVLTRFSGLSKAAALDPKRGPRRPSLCEH